MRKEGPAHISLREGGTDTEVSKGVGAVLTMGKWTET